MINMDMLQPFILYPDHQAVSLVLLFLSVSFILWMARNQVYKTLRSVLLGIAHILRFSARWLDKHAKASHQRFKDLSVEYHKIELERAIDKEYGKLETWVQRDLGKYPAMHQSLSELCTTFEKGYQDAQTPTYVENHKLTNTFHKKISQMNSDYDADKKKSMKVMLQGWSKEVKAWSKEQRSESSRKMKLFSKLSAPVRTTNKHLNKINGLFEKMSKTIRSVEEKINELHAIRENDDKSVRAAWHSILTRFMIGVFFTIIAAGGSMVNFLLIERPIAEMIGGGFVVMGHSASEFGALTIILVELASGIVFMEAWGLSHLIPKFQQMDLSTRKNIMWVSGTLLLAMAGVESGLAVLREVLMENDQQIQAMIGGADALAASQNAASGVLSTHFPTAIQAVMGFVIPLILAFVSIALEILFYTSRIVFQMTWAMILWLLSGLLRICATIFQRLFMIVLAGYDLLIFFWITLATWLAPLFSWMKGKFA